jgi:DNA-binding NarL/FixJ family response regulator
VPTPDRRLRALLVDDQVVAVRGAQVYLAALGVEVCGTIDDPRRLVSTYLSSEPDVTIENAIITLRRLGHVAPGDKIIVVTDIVSQDRLVEAIQLRTIR